MVQPHGYQDSPAFDTAPSTTFPSRHQEHIPFPRNCLCLGRRRHFPLSSEVAVGSKHDLRTGCPLLPAHGIWNGPIALG